VRKEVDLLLEVQLSGHCLQYVCRVLQIGCFLGRQFEAQDFLYAVMILKPVR